MRAPGDRPMDRLARWWNEEITFGGCAFQIIILAVGLAIISLGVEAIRKDAAWHNAPITEAKAMLRGIAYNASTLETRVAPVFHDEGGTSFAVYTDGHGEERTTIWDVEGHGNVVCSLPEVFQRAPAVGQTAVLQIKTLGTEVRIIGVK